MPLERPVDFGFGGSILGAKTTFLVHFSYLVNRLKFIAHILTQGKSWDVLVPFGRLVGFGSFIFWAKTTFLVHLPYPLNVAISRPPCGVQVRNSSNLHVLQNYKHAHVKHTHPL